MSALPVFAGSVSVGACADDQLEVVFFRQLYEVTAPPPLHEPDSEIAPPLVPSAPLVGVRAIEHPDGGVAVLEPCQVTATEAEPESWPAVACAV